MKSNNFRKMLSTKTILQTVGEFQPLALQKEKEIKAVKNNFRTLIGNSIDVVPDDYLLPLYKFIGTKPFSYYHEEVFQILLSFLEASYTSNKATVNDVLSKHNNDFLRGAMQLEFLCLETIESHFDRKRRKQKFETYILPWYIKLCEDVFHKIIRIPLAILGTARGKNYDNLDTFNQSETLSNSKLSLLTKDYDSLIRNAASHGGVDIDSNKEKITFTDKEVSKTLFNDEITSIFESFLDVCNSIVLAVKIFQLKYYPQFRKILSLSNLPDTVKNEFLIKTHSSSVVKVNEVEIVKTSNGKTQLNLHTTHKALRMEELLLYCLKILLQAHSYYPNVEQIFLGLNKKKKAGLIRVKSSYIEAWKNGSIQDKDFFTILFKNSLLWPIKYPLARIMCTMRYVVPKFPQMFREEYRRRVETDLSFKPRIPWEILFIEDLSTVLAKRYRAVIKVPETIFQNEVRELIHKITSYVRKQHIYHNKRAKRYWRLKKADYVWLFIFTKEKRPRDMIALNTLSYFVCRTEWVNPNRKNLERILPLYDQTIKNIGVIWNPNFVTKR